MGKYYTVTYEDLAHGLECEVKKDGKWTKWSFNLDSPFLTFVNLVLIAKYIKYGEVRCKYLDRGDIEECGWVLKEEMKYDRLYFWDKQTKKHSIIYNLRNKWMLITVRNDARSEDYTAFAGYVNNKSELKRIMKQVGIS